MEPEFANRVAYSLPRAWNHDLLACREKVHLHLFAAQKLLILRSRCDDRRVVAPLHQCGDPKKLCRYAWTIRGSICFLSSARLPLTPPPQEHLISEAIQT